MEVDCIMPIYAYKDGILQEIPHAEESRYEIIANIDRDHRTMRIVIPSKCSIILRRTVERQARSIAKSNFCDLSIEDSDKIPEIVPTSAPSPAPVEPEPITEVIIEQEIIEPPTPITPVAISHKSSEPPEIPAPPEPAPPEIVERRVDDSEPPTPLKHKDVDYVDRHLEVPKETEPLPVTELSEKSRMLSKAADILGFEEGDFLAALFLWNVLVNTIKLDNVVKLGNTITMGWDDGGALEFIVEDNKELDNLLILSVLGQKAVLIKDIWKKAMKWQKLIKK